MHLNIVFLASLAVAQAPARPASCDAVKNAEAVVGCTASSGRIESCEVLSETPPGCGFGAAAVSIVRERDLRPRQSFDRRRQTVTFTVRVPFTFDPPSLT